MRCLIWIKLISSSFIFFFYWTPGNCTDKQTNILKHTDTKTHCNSLKGLFTTAHTHTCTPQVPTPVCAILSNPAVAFASSLGVIVSTEDILFVVTTTTLLDRFECSQKERLVRFWQRSGSPSVSTSVWKDSLSLQKRSNFNIFTCEMHWMFSLGRGLCSESAL